MYLVPQFIFRDILIQSITNFHIFYFHPPDLLRHQPSIKCRRHFNTLNTSYPAIHPQPSVTCIQRKPKAVQRATSKSVNKFSFKLQLIKCDLVYGILGNTPAIFLFIYICILIEIIPTHGRR